MKEAREAPGAGEKNCDQKANRTRVGVENSANWEKVRCES